MLMRLKRNALPKSACENEKLIIEFTNQTFFLGQCNFGLDSDEHMDVKEEKRELSFLSKKRKTRTKPHSVHFCMGEIWTPPNSDGLLQQKSQ